MDHNIKPQTTEAGTIQVQNARGEAVTTARIIVQNEIGYVPKVSIIIPVYNAGDYLRECLGSLIRQTLKEIEIICVNDGSTDASLEILKEYARKDRRITILTQSNLYAGVARNAGLAVARGEYLSFLDADDFFEKDMLEEAYRTARKSDSDVVIYNVNFYNNQTKKFESPRWILNEHLLPRKNEFSPREVCDCIFNITNNWPWNKLFRTEFVNQFHIRYQSIKHTNDTYFVCVSLALARRISVIRRVLLHYRTHSESTLTTKEVRNSTPLNVYCVIKKIQDRLKEEKIYEIYKRSFINLCCNHLAWNIRIIDNPDSKKQLVDAVVKANLFDFPRNLPDSYFLSQDLVEKYKELVRLFPVEDDVAQIIKAYDESACKVISFDIFDTLLFRPYNKPSDLFLHLEGKYSKENFAVTRMDAERIARRKIREGEEITLGDIYALMPSDMQFLMQKEVELEKEKLFANDSNKYLFDYFRNAERKIVLTSDMYLSSSVISDILGKKGIKGYHKIYLSSEIKKTKRTGNLFKYVCDDLKIKPSELTHIGDNEQSDWLVPKALGIKAFLLRRYKNNEPEQYITSFANRGNSLPSSVLLFLFRCKSPRDYWYNIGYNLGGPMAVLMAQFIERNVKEYGIEELLFIARDGYILEKVYNLLSEKPKKTHYIYASRGLIKNLNTTGAIAQYQSYLNDQDIRGKAIGLVDLTTINCSAQKYLLKRLHGKMIRGIYWLANKEVDEEIKYNAIFGRPHKVEEINFLAETLISAPHAPVNMLRDKRPVFEKYSSIEDKRCDIYSRLAEGILEFAKEFHRHFSNGEVDLDGETVFNVLYSFVENYTPDDYSHFSQLSHSGNLYNTDNKPLNLFLDRFNKKKISIIICVHNTGKYLQECMESIVHQTLKEIEIICVNDGSTDDSLEILKEYAQKDRRVVLMDQKNQGLACSRNNALKIARGEYVQFVDSDDLIRGDTCEKLYKNARENDLDMLCFSGYNFTETPSVRCKNPYWAHRAILLSLKGKKIFNMQSLKEIACKIPVSSCLTLYRNAFLKKYDIQFPPGLCFEDNVFFVKSLTKAARISIDPGEYYIRRIRKDAITQNWDNHFSDYFEITDIVLGYLKNIRVDESVYNSYKRSYLDRCVSLYRAYGKGVDEKAYDLKIKKIIAKYGKTSRYFPCYLNVRLLLAFVSLPHTLLYYKALMCRLSRYIWARMNVLRIDIKNLGNKNNTVTIEARDSKVISPSWFRNVQGEGRVLTSAADKGKIKISAIRDGKLSINFRGPDMRFEGKRIPLWIDYKSIKIDGKDILSSPVATWHDKPWSYGVPVKDGQDVRVEYERQPHAYSRKELKETILKLNPTSEMISENIDALTDKIKKIISHAK